jgi:hypothetical protein
MHSLEFIQDLEKVTERRIALQKRGPREKIVTYVVHQS